MLWGDPWGACEDGTLFLSLIFCRSEASGPALRSFPNPHWSLRSLSLL